MLKAFDHVNIRTGNLDSMIKWYADVLGMPSGKRPPFDFPGAWLYLGDHALIHLVGVKVAPKVGEPTLEHFAIRAEGLQAFLDKLDGLGVPKRVSRVPGFGITQVNLHDPDGNHIHIDFDPSETADV